MQSLSHLFRSGLALLIFVFAAICCAGSEPREQAPSAEPNRIQVGLMFHFNQDLVPYAVAAERIVYERILRTLREYPQVPVQIHISGTLTHMMQWIESPVIDLIREGVQQGQFELLVSTYAQNIIEATADTLLNGLQYRMHRDLMYSMFGVEPGTFWNAERVWTPRVAETIAGWGDYAVPVESHILLGAGLDALDRRMWRYQTDAGPLTLIHDDARFRVEVNHVLNTGETEGLLQYLSDLNTHRGDQFYYVTWYEDAEAAGLWQYEHHSVHPDSTMQRLRTLLQTLSDTDWIQPMNPTAFVTSVPLDTLRTRVPDGEALWMIEYTRELGYGGWFDYLERNPLKRRIMDFFDVLGEEVRRAAGRVDAAEVGHPAHAFWQEALRIYAAYSYELGASWYWSGNDAGFFRAAELRFALFAMDESLRYGSFAGYRDVNGDGIQEYVIRRGDVLWIFQAREARVLYAFDLASGEVLWSNPWSYYYAEEWEPGNAGLPVLGAGDGVFSWLAGRPEVADLFDLEFGLRQTGPYLSVSGEGLKYRGASGEEPEVEASGVNLPASEKQSVDASGGNLPVVAAQHAGNRILVKATPADGGQPAGVRDQVEGALAGTGQPAGVRDAAVSGDSERNQMDYVWQLRSISSDPEIRLTVTADNYGLIYRWELVEDHSVMTPLPVQLSYVEASGGWSLIEVGPGFESGNFRGLGFKPVISASRIPKDTPGSRGLECGTDKDLVVLFGKSIECHGLLSSEQSLQLRISLPGVYTR